MARQALFPPDPGAFRLIAAGRATLGGLLTLGLALLLRGAMPMPFTARVLGFAVAMFLGALVRDQTTCQQAWTIAMTPVPVFAVACLVALALPVAHLPDALTVLTVFAGIAVASCGPRAMALGTVSLIALLVALLSRLTPADLPSRLVVIVLAAGCAALVRFVILPDRPATDIRRLRRAALRGIDGILSCTAAALGRGGWGRGDRHRLRRGLARLNEAVMLAQTRLEPAPALHLLEVELMVERIARVAGMDLGDAAQRPASLAQIAELRAALAAGSPPQVMQPPPAGRLGGVLAAMALLLAQPAPADTLRDAGLPAPSVTWSAIDIRPAIQAALATALAILGGTLVSANRWYWAVFSAFVLFQGTRSRGELLAKAVQMMLGTLAGVVVGVLLATLLAGHVVLTMAAIVGGVFLAILASAAAYGAMVFWITVILGLLFGMLGYFPPQLLLLRLQETAVGAAAGIVVAWLVLARPTPDLVRRCSAGFLRALGAVVAAAARPLLRQPPADGGALALTLTLEQQYQALRIAGAPHLPGARFLGADRTRRLLLLLGACDDWARELARTSLHLPPQTDSALSAVAAQTTARIADSIAALTAALDGHSGTATPPLRPEPAPVAAIPEGDDPAIHAARLLLRIDAALVHLRQRLAV